MAGVDASTVSRMEGCGSQPVKATSRNLDAGCRDGTQADQASGRPCGADVRGGEVDFSGAASSGVDARSSVRPGDMGNGCSETWVTASLNVILQIDACDLVSSEEDAELPVDSEGPDGEKLAAEGFGNTPAPFAKAEIGLDGAGPAHDRPFLIFGFAQLAWQRTRAWPIPVRWHIVVQGLVWALGIVNVPPTVERVLEFAAGSKCRHRQHFGLQRAMETLILAFGLRMMRARVDDVDAELEQPDTEFGPSNLRASTPRHTVVDQECVRQAIAPKRPLEVLLNRLTLLIGAGLQAQGIARMVIDHGERVTHLSIAQSEAPLEVHLPEVVRRSYGAGGGGYGTFIVHTN